MQDEHLPNGSRVRETGLVAEYCTCGAQLPPDALFCHKCGKPQREIVAVEAPEAEEEPVVEPVIPPPEAPPLPPVAQEIGFHNGPAVRSAFLAAALSSLFISLPTPVLLTLPWMLVWLVFAGFFAVRFYLRRSGMAVTVRGGLRMGWITGVFCFVIAMVFFTITIISISSQEGLAAFY
ncbi:MAG: zinc ribbon domain-containing protein, partial [Bryobacteraceae bacterium]